jgi:hypothetical protein
MTDPRRRPNDVVPILPDDTAVPWYQRRVTALQRAALLLVALVCGGVAATSILAHRVDVGRLTEQYPTAQALATVALTLLQVLCAWLIAGQATRLAPYAGLFMAGASSLGAAYGNAIALVAVAVLVAVALAVRPRARRRVTRTCIALLACVIVALEASAY